MNWNTQEIELSLERRLKKKFSRAHSEATKYFGYYTYARDILISEKIFEAITNKNPELSDHGAAHIKDVLFNAFKLLGSQIEKIDAIELYFICIIILFHDVGNLIADREHHSDEDVIREIYDHIRNKLKEFDEERALVPTVASKHSGKASDGSKDTIKELSILPPHLFNTEIYSKKCAALLRLADELAEGFQRTSTFMNKYYNYPYKENSVIYHKYADISKVNIDRQNERICLTYNFKIEAINGAISVATHDEFIELYNFAIRRMLKVDAERKYCKYYCDWLSPFKRTDVTFNYYVENQIGNQIKSRLINLDNSILILDDLVLPVVETSSKFYLDRGSYEPENVFTSIKNEFNEK